MPSTFTNDDVVPEARQSVDAARSSTLIADTLVCLPAISRSALDSALNTIAAAFPGQQVSVATPHLEDDVAPPAGITLAYYATDRANLGWVLAAADYAAAAKLAEEQNITTLLLLSGAPVPSDASLLHSLAEAVRSGADLAVPRFHLGPNDGLVTAALLYPLSRSLFGADIRFPLPAEAALSLRMAQRLASVAQRLVAINQGSAIVWPIAEAAIAGFSVREVDAAIDAMPAPPEGDFNALFANVAGSLFADIEARAAFWQRARSLPARSSMSVPVTAAEAAEISPDVISIIENFQLAQKNLEEIWSLVLPPQTRLALKKLSQLSASEFAFEPGLWARTVYDFALAFHLRTLNRNHLIGAMTPLYIAWVASHIRTVADDPARAVHAAEQAAAAFETEKPYFVSRWRWPDRFNP